MSKYKTFIVQNRANGFTLEPMAIRLLESQANFGKWGDSVIADLKTKAIKRNTDGVYFFPEQIADKKTRKDIVDTSKEWIKTFGCFSLNSLFGRFQHKIRNIFDDISDFENFLNILEEDETYKTIWYPPMTGKTRLVRAVKTGKETAIKIMKWHIEKLFDEQDTITESSLLEHIPALDPALLSSVVKEYLPNVSKQKNNDLLWYCRQHLSIPPDLSEKIISCIQQIENVDLPVSIAALQLLLSLAYQTHFMKTFDIADNKAFRTLVDQHYSGKERRWSGGVFSIVQE